MSIAPDVAHDELFALIDGAGGEFADVLRLPQLPVELPKAKDRLYVTDNVTDYRRSRAASDYVEETFNLIVVIECWRSDKLAAPAKARAWQLFDALDALLERNDFYGFGSEDGELVGNLATSTYDSGWLAALTVTIPLQALS